MLYPWIVSAVQIVAPNANEFTEGNSNNNAPFKISNMHYQEVYLASEFGSQSGTIEEIRFRLDDTFGGNFSTSYDIEIILSHTTAAPDTLSFVFANNLGGRRNTGPR